MEIFNIYWHDGCGNRDYIATTNNLDKWLVDHNEWRVAEGNEPEDLDDFEIEEGNSYIYEEPIEDNKKITTLGDAIKFQIGLLQLALTTGREELLDISAKRLEELIDLVPKDILAPTKSEKSEEVAQ